MAAQHNSGLRAGRGSRARAGPGPRPSATLKLAPGRADTSAGHVLSKDPEETNMRHWRWCFLALILLAAPRPASAGQPRCPLPLDVCIQRFGAMRERPWLGVEIEVDSLTGVRVVHSVVPGGPADRAGVKPGDTLRKLGGVDPAQWFAGKAGWKHDWKEGDVAAITVGRAGHDRSLPMPLVHISEETLAQIIGVHILEAHLAYMDGGQAHEDQ
jgi:hypothetical protein